MKSVHVLILKEYCHKNMQIQKKILYLCMVCKIEYGIMNKAKISNNYKEIQRSNTFSESHEKYEHL